MQRGVTPSFSASWLRTVCDAPEQHRTTVELLAFPQENNFPQRVPALARDPGRTPAPTRLTDATRSFACSAASLRLALPPPRRRRLLRPRRQVACWWPPLPREFCLNGSGEQFRRFLGNSGDFFDRSMRQVREAPARRWGGLPCWVLMLRMFLVYLSF